MQERVQTPDVLDSGQGKRKDVLIKDQEVREVQVLARPVQTGSSRLQGKDGSPERSVRREGGLRITEAQADFPANGTD